MYLDMVEHKKSNLERVLETFAYHCGVIMTSPDPVVSLGLSHGNVQVMVTFEFRERSHGNSVWDQVYVEGKWLGNRCAARDHYARMAAPVLMAAAKDDEAQATRH